MKSALRGVLMVCLVLASLTAVTAHADPANCDDDMTEDQRWTAKLCSAHAGCALVFGIQDSCVKAKSFLSRFGSTGSRRASSLSDEEVGDAMVASGVPRSGLSSCLFSFDRAKCMEFLSGGPKPPSAKEKADELAERLNSGVYNTTGENSPLALNRQALRMCEDATSEKGTRDAVRAKERCALAEKGVQNCASRKQSHDELRTQLRALLGDASLGADAARYRALASAPYPECPATLPGTGKTPQAALAEYLKFWDTPADAEPKTDVALPRRGGNSGGDRFKQAINQADQDERERPAREARARAERERIAAAEASLTPQQRLARSFDERINTARQECATRESSCNTGCLGIGAVGLISLFSRNSAGTTAATEQVQQCTNRCDQEKSSCEQQVAALEADKREALSNLEPKRAGSSTEPISAGLQATSGGLSSSGECIPDENLIARAVEASNISREKSALRNTAWEKKIATTESVRKSYAEMVARAREMSESYAQEIFEMRKKESMGGGRRATIAAIPDWISNDTNAQNRLQLHALECVIAARKKNDGTKSIAGGSHQSAASNFPATCSFAGFEQAFNGWRGRYPHKSSWGSRDNFQYAHFMGIEGLKILQTYKPCMSQAQYDDNFRALAGSRDQGLRGCRQLSSDGGANCRAEYP